MVDAKRTVEIEIKVTGFDKKTVESISNSFKELGKASNTLVSAISTVSDSLKSIKAPKSLTDIVDSLKKFNGIKIPNITQMADGFKKLSAISSLPNFKTFC
jgi:hypothetical protein